MSDFRPRLGDRVIAVRTRFRDKPIPPMSIRYADDEPEREKYEERIPGRIEMRYVFVDENGTATVPEAFDRFEAI